MTVVYQTDGGLLRSALRWRHTIIPMVLTKPEFFLFLGLNLTINWAYKAGLFNPVDYHMDLAMSLTSVTGGLMTFFVVFYNGNVFTRYSKLHVLTKTMNEKCLIIVSIISKEVKSKNVARKLGRMVLASAFVFCFTYMKDEDRGPLEDGVTEKRWQSLVRFGLLDKEEQRLLANHCEDVGQDRAMPSFLLLHWSLKLYRTQLSRMNDLERHFYDMRKTQEQIAELLSLPIPFQYYHVMNLMLLLNLGLWAYALALEDSVFAPLIFFFTQLMFQGIRELTIALADPFGTDETDFPLSEWMSEIYVRVQCLLEDPWDPARHLPEHVGELPMLWKDVDVIDLIEGNVGAWVEENKYAPVSQEVPEACVVPLFSNGGISSQVNRTNSPTRQAVRSGDAFDDYRSNTESEALS
eukprot:TRINITY_DN25600_c0_g1_i1.p1 TRINITY_DN25600_c0_g1~~TRINITY_DN25600_c0_g1_i1.p1  ORF type:complete len:408 (+),score=58.93 TRINITY_DN25600_c0_g1_i1:218-1441(+)